MRRWPATLLVASTGCAQLFGLDTTTSPDADPSRVSLTMQRWSIGASVSKNPLDLTGQTAAFLVDDGAGNFLETAAEQSGTGVFSAAILTGTPPVMFSLPDKPKPLTRLWATPNRDRRGVLPVFEHPSPQDPLPNSSITLTAALPSPYVSTEAFRIEALGAWTGRAITPTQLADGTQTTITATMPYAMFSPLTSSPAARITSADVVVIERYVGNKLTGVYQVPPFDQTDGADPINANVVQVPDNKTLSVTLNPTTFSQRFSAVRPAVTGLAQSWIVTAAPGWSIGAINGPRLHAGSVTTETTFSTMFGNPFESLDWRSLFYFAASSSRTYMFMGTAALGLSASMDVIAEPTGPLTLDMPAGLPVNIRVNQTPLSTDGMTVALDLTKGVEVDAITDKPNNTSYVVTLYEVSLDMNMAAQKTLVVDAFTTGEPKVRFPPDLFQVGHWYYFDVRSIQGGFLNAAMGDLVTYTLPFTSSRADSAVFQVVAP